MLFWLWKLPELSPDDAFRAGWRKLGPKNKIPEVFITKKAKKKRVIVLNIKGACLAREREESDANFPDQNVQRHCVTSLETARSLVNYPSGEGLRWNSPGIAAFPISLLSMGGVCGRSLTAGEILFTGRQTCSLVSVLWLCARNKNNIFEMFFRTLDVFCFFLRTSEGLPYLGYHLKKFSVRFLFISRVLLNFFFILWLTKMFSLFSFNFR